MVPICASQIHSSNGIRTFLYVMLPTIALSVILAATIRVPGMHPSVFTENCSRVAAADADPEGESTLPLDYCCFVRDQWTLRAAPWQVVEQPSTPNQLCLDCVCDEDSTRRGCGVEPAGNLFAENFPTKTNISR
jgi:hypothetical protein